ncbi:lipopolysaccharide transport periplasmic protein LptA [Roseobacter sp. YSTF-M11]|uniref:Lipopolysaccharide transport periplasmic protein LptA n=2 Tax=Roseobacter insulae TaxID=2859783 RepID=A0A9X1FTJ1_9RHOB|nr:lipopolysaccharide transport periplasmic protein LptA [Roseobacter insulae]MBW4706840.1 lipopolysaccharide transport periplasmic protein LptA [Roseobacter insulae]
MKLLKLMTLPLIILATAPALMAQGTQVAFGALQQDKSLPVEVTADNLSVDQATGTAVFTGNVVVGQGEMRLSAKRVLVVYREETDGIESMEATGDVLLVSGPDAAESEKANYNIDDGTIVMTGNVLLTQGPSALTADRMTVQLESGTAQMSGSVKTILQTGDN